MIITNLRDEELIFFLSLHSDRANRSIKEKYFSKSSFLVNETVSKFPNISSTKDLLINVCFLNLNKTIEKTDYAKPGIGTYWRKSSIHSIQDIIIKESKLINNTISIDKRILLKDSEVCLEEVIPAKIEKPRLNFSIEDAKQLLKQEGFDMDFDEKQIFEYYLEGLTLREMKNKFPEYSTSKIYRLLQQTKDKLRDRLAYIYSK